MLILFDGQQLSRQMTGVGYYTDRVLRGMLARDRSHEWLILAVPQNSEYVSEIAALHPKAKVARLDRPVPLDYRAQQEMLARLIAQCKVNLYFSPSFLSVPRSCCPCISAVHDATYVLYPEFHGPGVAEYLHSCVANTCSNASRIITMSGNSKRDICRFYHCPADRVRTIPLAADGEFAGEKPAEAVSAVRGRYGLPERYVLAVNMGNRKKNAPSLLRAYARVSEDLRRGMKLAIVGEWSPDALDLPKLAHEAGIAGETVITGHVSREDLHLLYAGALVFCFPSLHEGFGLPVLEAMASGVPVISSNAASLPEVAGDAAVLLDPQDEAGWAEAIERMATDEGLRQSYSRRGRERASGFSWDKTAQATLEVIGEVLHPVLKAAPAAAADVKPEFVPVDLGGFCCAVTVDDVRPAPGFGGRREADTLGMFLELHKEFGAKFTLFTPTDWQGRWPLSAHLDWLGWLLEQPCFEIACHGHLHATETDSPDPGEFRGASPEGLEETIRASVETFALAGHKPAGVRPPGWFLEPSAYRVFDRHFQYVADHVIGQNVSRLAGGKLLRFPYLYSIDELGAWPREGLVVLHSHVAPEGRTTNGWDRALFERVRAFLKTGARRGVKFATLGEIANGAHEDPASGNTERPSLGTVVSADPRLRGGEVKTLGAEAGVLYHGDSAPCNLELDPQNAGIVILSRNRKGYLADLLASIDETGPKDLGRVVILNNSDDDSAGHVRSHFPNWRVVEVNDADHPEEPAGLAWLKANMPGLLPVPTERLGPKSGWTNPRSIGWLRNRQFAECGRDFLVNFDDDFVVKPGWWEYYVRFQREFAAHAVMNNFGAFVMCRTVPEKIGLLDERFLGSHGYEDNDYVARMAEARLRWVLGFNKDHDWRSAEEGNPRGSMTGADYFIHRYALRSGGYSARRDEGAANPVRAAWNARWFGAKWAQTHEDTGVFPRPPFMGTFLRRKIGVEPDWGRPKAGPAVPRGRKRYFIDCGAHIGESIVRAKELYGQDTCVVAFEAVPYLAHQLARLWKDDDSVIVHNALVWTDDGIKDLHISTEWSDGSSAYASKTCGGVGKGPSIGVPSIDLSRWLRESFDSHDEVILKLDIEGAEYEVLAKMIREGSIGIVKKLCGELHDGKIDDEGFRSLSALVRFWLDRNGVAFHVWEAHGVTGKLAERPKDMGAVAAWRPPSAAGSQDHSGKGRG
ncbi:MAG TPA: FkbM family methyltransferase [Planctomycetota bacterium]|nr:FkbM family methyltransferase [Planctomycetota bacterium]